MAVLAVFVVLFMFVATVKTQDGGAEFSNTEVKLTCPGKGTWQKGDPPTPETSAGDNKTFTFKYTQKVKYSCEYSESDVTKKYKFYVQGRVCQNCFELDAKFFVVIIVVDLIGTAVVMMIIYKCSKKKSSDKPPPIAKPPSRPGNRPAHGSDYETLNPNTRAMDTYSTVVNNSGMLNRTG